MESWVQSWRPRTKGVLRFFRSTSLSIAPATKKWCQVIQSAAPVTQNHLPKTEDLMLQNATPLRKSAPWPPNISIHFWWTCLLHCACHAKCIFPDPLKCPTLPSFSEMLTFCSLLTRCTIPCACHAKRHLSAQKWSVCFAPQRRALFDISTSKSGPSMLWLYILTWTCTSRRNGVQFFISHLATRHASTPAALASYFLTLGSHKSLEKRSVSRLCYLFAHLHLLSFDSFSALIFSLLLFSSLTLPTSAFPSVHIVGSLTSQLP